MRFTATIITRLNVCAFLIVGMAACFTGVESTPKITAREIKKQKVVDSPEKKFLSNINPQSTSEWSPGKKFIVTDPRVALIFERSSGIDGEHQPGTILTLNDIRPSTSITGEKQTLLEFTTSVGDTLHYRTNITTERFALRETSLNIPFTVEASLIDSVAQRLVGNTFYILPQRRINTLGRDTIGLRYVPVNINTVTFGDAYYPLRIWFSHDASSNDKKSEESLMMTIGDGPTATRNFETLFAFSDPRKLYPQISDENWSLIQKSQVALGMTTQECRLALGAPNDWSQRPSTAGMVERWRYEDGVYLLFIDGLLSQFRK